MGWTGSAIVAGLAAVSSGVQADQARQSQKRGRARQGQAQQRAESAAASQQRQAQEAERRATRKKPDFAAILANAQAASQRGIGGTLLSGNRGVAPGGLQLGRTSLLGE